MEQDLTNKTKTCSKSARFLAVTVLVFVGTLIVAWVVYECFGHVVIKAMYDGKGPEMLRKLIQFQHKYPVEHYQQIGDGVFFRLILIVSVCFGLAAILYRLVFSEGELRPIWVILACMSLIATFYVLNPHNRVYSVHGFFHASMVYQILNGCVPPSDPLFAGYPLHYPWAYAFLVAQVSRMFDISPFYVYSIVHVLALGLLILLTYKISALLLFDKRACVFASLIAVFGSTVLTRNMLNALTDMIHLGHFQVNAAINKFLNINALPLGQVFFYWSVYLLIRIFTGKARVRLYVMFLLASVGCGFFYPGFLPCIVGIVILMGAGRLVLGKTDFFAGSFRPIVASFMVVGLACLCVWPYMTSTTLGVAAYSQVFNLTGMIQNVTKGALVMLPIIIIILANRKYLLEYADRPAMGVLFVVIAVTTGCYTVLHISTGGEDKFVLLSLVALGMPGGIAFYRLRERLHRVLFVFLLCVFLLPSGTIIMAKLRVYGNSPLRFYKKSPEFAEDGENLLHRDSEHSQFYQWIKANTPVDSVFIDTGWDIPVYARRRLLVTMDTSSWAAKKGYGLDTTNLSRINRYGPAVCNQRIELVRNVYGYDHSMGRREILATLAESNIYVAVRSEGLPCEFNSEGLSEVFLSSQGRFRVYVSEQNLRP